MARDRRREIGELLRVGLCDRLFIEELECRTEVLRSVLRRLADHQQPNVTTRRAKGERVCLRQALLPDQDDREVARCIGRRIERLGTAQQPFRDHGGPWIIGIMLEGDLDEHPRKLATAPRALADRPRQCELLALPCEAVGERVSRKHERRRALGRCVGLDCLVDGVEPSPRQRQDLVETGDDPQQEVDLIRSARRHGKALDPHQRGSVATIVDHVGALKWLELIRALVLVNGQPQREEGIDHRLLAG